MDGVVRLENTTAKEGNYPLKRESVINYMLLNVSMPPDHEPMAGAEIEGIFLISFSRGPPDDFSVGGAVIATTGQIIRWSLPDEDAKARAPGRGIGNLPGVSRGGGGP
jgi:hypothetical protein